MTDEEAADIERLMARAACQHNLKEKLIRELRSGFLETLPSVAVITAENVASTIGEMIELRFAAAADQLEARIVKEVLQIAGRAEDP